MLTVDSQAPITLTQPGQATKVYSKWGAPVVQLRRTVEDKFELIIPFKMYTETGEEAPFSPSVFLSGDVLTDETLAPLAAAFFQGVVQKAFATGILT